MPVAWAALTILVVACALAPSANPVANPFGWNDKLLHVLAFATLACVGRNTRAVPRVLAGAGLIALAAAIEVAQTLMSLGRDGALPDFIASACGVVFGHMMARAVRWGEALAFNSADK